MTDRPRFFDDLAGVAGGAFSALAGVREEIGAIVRARVDEALSSLNLVRREEFEVVRELASRARSGQEDAEARLSALESRIAALEADSGRFQPYAPPQDPAPFNSF
ncbi:accessory factor UbiK family protein [Gluconacetobacter azotocaptans]|uniref:Accessory factor UbiK family protein n=1 Tax=Gluconacetobacter azotocaptans TaxID=142834 RepID=A0A7W4JUZ3_9PROT|nr:accessory factor UbiK family protein [Gluconacetobacter azotocaptans]MBB2191388.1 accessory factor UbiK family protein [Gluconacetobacter azotocaptans]